MGEFQINIFSHKSSSFRVIKIHASWDHEKKMSFNYWKKSLLCCCWRRPFLPGVSLSQHWRARKPPPTTRMLKLYFFCDIQYAQKSVVVRVLNIFPSYRQKRKNGKIKICERRNFNERVWTSLSSIFFFFSKTNFSLSSQKIVLRNIPERDDWIVSSDFSHSSGIVYLSRSETGVALHSRYVLAVVNVRIESTR